MFEICYSVKTFNILSIIFSVNYEKMEPQWSNYDYGQQNVQGKSYGNKRALEDVTNKETPSSSSHNFTFKKPKNDNFDNNYVLTEL